MEKEHSNEYCKHVFTEAEKKEIAGDMAQKVSELQRLEDEIKAVRSDFKSQIDRVQAEVNNSATKINNGYEMRSVKCEIVHDFEDGYIKYIRSDNGEIAKKRKMTDDDRQMKIND